MAKCGITNIGGGGGIGSDELSVTKDYVLSGLEYVGADTDDEKGVGIMIDNGTTANQNLNAGGSFLVKGGYHAQPFSVNANSLASQTPGNTTNDRVLNGFKYWSNGVQGTGTMPNYGGVPSQINNIRINNNRFEVAVAKGYHGEYWAGNSYEYMSYDQVANAIGLTPAKLKKGETVCGRTGTFEGYVPTATDLYLRGNNIAGWTMSNGSYTVNTFESGGIMAVSSTRSISVTAGYGRYGPRLTSASALNLTPYNYLNIEFKYNGYSWYGKSVRNLVMKAILTAIDIGEVGSVSVATSATVASINISNLSYTKRININLGIAGEQYESSTDDEPAGWYALSEMSWNGWIYRIWLS